MLQCLTFSIFIAEMLHHHNLNKYHMIKWSKKLQTQKIEYVVYSIKNLKSKKKYIGYTCNFARRMNEHRLMSKKKKLPKQNLLYRDLKRLGFDRFEFKKIQSALEKCRGEINFTIDKAIANIESLALKNVEFEKPKEEIPF